MTNDEIMVFKQYEHFKDRDAALDTERSCFHAAFDHPSTTETTEER